MSESSEYPLPRVEDADILSLVLPEIIDPQYRAHWEELARANPRLARALLERAYIESDGKPDEQKRLLDMAIFTTEALRAALLRLQREKILPSDGDDEGSQPSAALPHGS